MDISEGGKGLEESTVGSFSLVVLSLDLGSLGSGGGSEVSVLSGRDEGLLNLCVSGLEGSIKLGLLVLDDSGVGSLSSWESWVLVVGSGESSGGIGLGRTGSGISTSGSSRGSSGGTHGGGGISLSLGGSSEMLVGSNVVSFGRSEVWPVELVRNVFLATNITAVISSFSLLLEKDSLGIGEEESEDGNTSEFHLKKLFSH